MKNKKRTVFQPAQTPEQRKKRIRNIIIALVIVAAAAVACDYAMPKNRDLSQSSVFDKAQVEAAAEQAVQYVNEEDYEALKAMAVDEMASVLNKERMDEAKARVSEDWGEFREISSVTTTEVTQRGVTAAVAYVAAEYENTGIRYTFAFNEDMKLASFGIQ